MKARKSRKWIFLLFVLGVLGPRNAYTKDGSEIAFESVKTHGGSVSLEVALTQAPSEVSFTLETLNTQQSFPLKGEGVPKNLWVLVDTSSICRTKGIDSYLNNLMSTLNTQLHRDSLISLVTYNSATVEIQSNHQPILDHPAMRVICEDQRLSTSYEVALKALLRNQHISSLPTVVWVFTSGNIELSSSMLDELSKGDLRLQLFLYNPIVIEAIRGTLNSSQRRLGEEKFRYSPFSLEAQTLPEIWSVLRFDPPGNLLGTKIAANLIAKSGDKILASKTVELTLPKSSGWIFWNKHGKKILLLATLLLLCYAGFRIWRFYQPHYCAHCKKRLSFPYRGGCKFCLADGDAFLVGRFNLVDPKKVGKQDVIRLYGDQTEIGTHRRSVIRMASPKKQKRRCLAKIQKETIDAKRTAFVLLKSPRTQDLPVYINDILVDKFRYLASGDTIRIQETEFLFYSQGRDPVNAAQA